MSKTISVIGPDVGRVEACAEALRGFVGTGVSVKIAAGPDARPDLVVAVVGEPTAEDLQVARAVSGSVGLVALLVDATAHPWPTFPGWHTCASVEEVAELADRVGVDMRSWISDAHRADAERVERVRMALRLRAHRLAAELTEVDPAEPAESAPGVDAAEAERLHHVFVAHMRVAVAEQGVHFPRVATDLVRAHEIPRAADASASGGIAGSVAGGTAGIGSLRGWLAVGAGAMAGAVGTAAIAYRMTHHLVPAILAAFLVWGALVGSRVWLLRARAREAQRRANVVYLRDVWAGMVADIIARLSIPRIADTLTTNERPRHAR